MLEMKNSVFAGDMRREGYAKAQRKWEKELDKFYKGDNSLICKFCDRVKLADVEKIINRLREIGDKEHRTIHLGEIKDALLKEIAKLSHSQQEEPLCLKGSDLVHNVQAVSADSFGQGQKPAGTHIPKESKCAT